MELPLIGNVLESATGGDSDDLVVQRITYVQKMLENLIHDRLLLLCNLDCNPLRDDNCNAAADDVEACLLLTSFRYECVLEEGVEVNLIMQDISSKADRRVNGVFEEDVFVIRCCYR